MIQSTPKITSLAGSLRSKHWTEPMPLVSHGFVADIDATFMKQTYNIAKEKQETDTQHQSQTDELATRFEMTKGIRSGHLQTPQDRPDCLKLVCSSTHARPGSSPSAPRTKLPSPSTASAAPTASMGPADTLVPRR